MDHSTCQVVPRVVLALGLVIAFSPATAWACTVVPPAPSLLGEPSDGDKEIPTDVVLHYGLPPSLELGDDPESVPGEYELRSASGEVVTLRGSRREQFRIELSPASPLLPNTTYTLRAHWQLANGLEGDDSLSFTTGAGPVVGPPDTPRALMQQYELTQDHSGACGPARTGSCVAVVNDRSWIEYTFVDEFDQEHWPTMVRGSFMASLTGIDQGTNFRCVDLRTRAANGVRSQPLRMCGMSAAPIHDLTALVEYPKVQCSARGLEWCDASGKSGAAPGLANAEASERQPECPTATQQRDPAANGAAGATTEAHSPDAGATPPLPTAGTTGDPVAATPEPAANTTAETAVADTDAQTELPPPPPNAAASCSALPARPHGPAGRYLFAALTIVGALFARRFRRA